MPDLLADLHVSDPETIVEGPETPGTPSIPAREYPEHD